MAVLEGSYTYEFTLESKRKVCIVQRGDEASTDGYVLVLEVDGKEGRFSSLNEALGNEGIIGVRRL